MRDFKIATITAIVFVSLTMNYHFFVMQNMMNVAARSEDTPVQMADNQEFKKLVNHLNALPIKK